MGDLGLPGKIASLSPLARIFTPELSNTCPLMRKISYFLVDVFTKTPFGGNQLAVIPNGHLVREEEMPLVAREFNLSETTFIFPPASKNHHAKVRIFTPGRELPFAGHPTLGTAFILANELNALSADEHTIWLEEGVGPIRVDISTQADASQLLVMSQPAPTFGAFFNDRSLLASLLSLTPDDLHPIHQAQTVSCGVPYLITPLRSLDVVKKVRFRLDVWEKVAAEFDPGWVYCFATGGEEKGSHVHGRMFAPEAGILEDPATGSANGPLGCYIVEHKLMGDGQRAEIVSEQGYEMGRPSKLYLEMEKTGSKFTQVKVGGYCVFMGKGELFLP